MNEHDQETRKQASVMLPYHKQGDDIQEYIDQCESLDDALEMHAQYMDSGAKQLREIRNAIEGHDVHISAGAHCIFIEGEAEVIDALVKDDLACVSECLDEPQTDCKSTTDLHSPESDG